MSKSRLEIISAKGVPLVAYCLDSMRLAGMRLLEQVREYDQNLSLPASVHDGTVIAVGWSCIVLRYRSDGIHLEEPNFGADAFQSTRDDVSTTLFIMQEQRDFMERVGIRTEVASFHNTLIVGGESLTRGRVYFERKVPTHKRDSGWYLGPRVQGDSAAPLKHLYIWNLINERSILLQFTQLPVGSLVMLDGDRIDAVFDPEGRRHD